MKFLRIQISRQYLINLITTFLSQACSAGMIIVLTPVLQQNFSVEEFSNYGVLLNIVLFAAAFDMGLNMGLMRRLIHEGDKASVLISTVFFLFLMLFVVAVPVFFILYAAGIVETGNAFLYNALLSALLVIQTVVAMLFDVILHSTNKIFVGKLIRIGKVLLELSLLLFFSRWGSATLLLLISGVVNFLYILLLYGYAKKERTFHIAWSYFNIRVLIDHIRYSFWYFLNAVSVVLAFNSQVIMLNALTGKADVAKYILVTRFLDVVRLGATNFTIILFPSLASLEAKGEWAYLRSNYFAVLKRVVVFSLLILLVLLTLGKYIFVWWSGEGGEDMLNLYYVFSVFTILIVVDNVSSVFLHAFRLNKGQTILSIGQGFMALAIGYFLLQSYGLVGMAIGSIIALLCTNFIYNPVFLMGEFRRRVRRD
jgi:O-antigen/teichoic acid export membrane protein